jgi:hypothetical protein
LGSDLIDAIQPPLNFLVDFLLVIVVIVSAT